MSDVCRGPGIYSVQRGELAWFEVKNGPSTMTYNKPDVGVIAEVCRSNDLPFSEISATINKATDDGAYGVFIDVDVYKAEQLKNSAVHMYRVNDPLIPYCKQKGNGWVQFNATAVERMCPDCQDRLGRKFE